MFLRLTLPFVKDQHLLFQLIYRNILAVTVEQANPMTALAFVALGSPYQQS